MNVHLFIYHRLISHKKHLEGCIFFIWQTWPISVCVVHVSLAAVSFYAWIFLATVLCVNDFNLQVLREKGNSDELSPYCLVGAQFEANWWLSSESVFFFFSVLRSSPKCAALQHLASITCDCCLWLLMVYLICHRVSPGMSFSGCRHRQGY